MFIFSRYLGVGECVLSFNWGSCVDCRFSLLGLALAVLEGSSNYLRLPSRSCGDECLNLTLPINDISLHFSLGATISVKAVNTFSNLQCSYVCHLTELGPVAHMLNARSILRLKPLYFVAHSLIPAYLNMD